MTIERYPIPCTPPRWARGGHGQTLLGHLLPAPGAVVSTAPDAQRHEIEASGGDRLVAFSLPPTGSPSGVRAHLFHGLSGDADSDYMRGAAAHLRQAGHEVWAVNHRGCGAGAGLAREPYHSGKTEDMQAVLAQSRATGAASVHVVVGFSLSGNMALLAAARGEKPRPDGILAINPPVDLLRATEDMARGLSRLYQLRFIWRLRRALRRRAEAGLLQRSYSIPLSATMLEFDDLFTAPECGFEDGRDYYRRCSAGPRLADVDTPAVILTAADDPFVDPRMFDRELSPQIFLHVEPHGGHVGYVEQGGPRGKRWLDGAISWYVDRLAARARCGSSPIDAPSLPAAPPYNSRPLRDGTRLQNGVASGRPRSRTRGIESSREVGGSRGFLGSAAGLDSSCSGAPAEHASNAADDAHAAAIVLSNT